MNFRTALPQTPARRAAVPDQTRVAAEKAVATALAEARATRWVTITIIKTTEKPTAKTGQVDLAPAPATR